MILLASAVRQTCSIDIEVAVTISTVVIVYWAGNDIVLHAMMALLSSHLLRLPHHTAQKVRTLTRST